MKLSKPNLQYWLPLLLLPIGAALFFDFGSVEEFDPQAVDYAPLASGGQPSSPSPQAADETVRRPALGERYTTLAQLVAVQQAAGFVQVGYFGRHWPAKVSEIQREDDGISFVRQNGTPHQYQGFEGFRMQMVRLIGPGNRETIVVFRSLDKR